MARERQELIDILNRLELTQRDRLDLEYYINLGCKYAKVGPGIFIKNGIRLSDAIERTIEIVDQEWNSVKITYKFPYEIFEWGIYGIVETHIVDADNDDYIRKYTEIDFTGNTNHIFKSFNESFTATFEYVDDEDGNPEYISIILQGDAINVYLDDLNESIYLANEKVNLINEISSVFIEDDYYKNQEFALYKERGGIMSQYMYDIYQKYLLKIDYKYNELILVNNNIPNIDIEWPDDDFGYRFFKAYTNFNSDNHHVKVLYDYAEELLSFNATEKEIINHADGIYRYYGDQSGYKFIEINYLNKTYKIYDSEA